MSPDGGPYVRAPPPPRFAPRRSLTLLAAAVLLPLAASPARAGYTVTDLGTLGGGYSYATGINAAGQVVGDSDTADGEFRAFLWEGGAMTDLNDLLPAGFTVTLTSAGGINDAGQIIAHGGDDRAYLLTPTNVAAVPEPASAVMLAAGAVGLAAFRQRLRRA